eukprot:719866-Amphidinium_carterae.1
MDCGIVDAQGEVAPTLLRQWLRLDSVGIVVPDQWGGARTYLRQYLLLDNHWLVAWHEAPERKSSPSVADVDEAGSTSSVGQSGMG